MLSLIKLRLSNFSSTLPIQSRLDVRSQNITNSTETMSSIVQQLLLTVDTLTIKLIRETKCMVITFALLKHLVTTWHC